MLLIQRWWAIASTVLAILLVVVIWYAMVDRPPTFGKTVRITAIEYSVVDRTKVSAEYDGFDNEGVSLLDMLLRPTTRNKDFEPYLNPQSEKFESANRLAKMVAEVTLEDSNGIKTVVYVREFGDNPALVSLDNKRWYFGGKEGYGGTWGNGGYEVYKALSKYGHRVQNLPESVNP